MEKAPRSGGGVRLSRGIAWGWLLCVLVALATALAAGPAAAFRLVPIVMEFEPAGRGATQSFGVINNTDKPVAVQITMVERRMDLDGKETYIAADDDFVVYPPQMVVMPDKVQVVRVSWVGEPNPAQELAFRIIAEQLPIELEKQPEGTRGTIRLLLRYEGSIYVTPKGVKPEVAVDSVQSTTGAAGARMIEVTLHNRGDGHGILHNPRLRVTAVAPGSGQGTAVELGPERLEGTIANANILAGTKRRFLLPWPNGLGTGALQAGLTTEYMR
ncbi:MAG: molecular chaperone [Proteobacteria bacterium]|nr:molecular chaperone [Pseudomonadota bacterium]